MFNPSAASTIDVRIVVADGDPFLPRVRFDDEFFAVTSDDSVVNRLAAGDDRLLIKHEVAPGDEHSFNECSAAIKPRPRPLEVGGQSVSNDGALITEEQHIKPRAAPQLKAITAGRFAPTRARAFSRAL